MIKYTRLLAVSLLVASGVAFGMHNNNQHDYHDDVAHYINWCVNGWQNTQQTMNKLGTLFVSVMQDVSDGDSSQTTHSFSFVSKTGQQRTLVFDYTDKDQLHALRKAVDRQYANFFLRLWPERKATSTNIDMFLSALKIDELGDAQQKRHPAFVDAVLSMSKNRMSGDYSPFVTRYMRMDAMKTWKDTGHIAGKLAGIFKLLMEHAPSLQQPTPLGIPRTGLLLPLLDASDGVLIVTGIDLNKKAEFDALCTVLDREFENMILELARTNRIADVQALCQAFQLDKLQPAHQGYFPQTIAAVNAIKGQYPEQQNRKKQSCSKVNALLASAVLTGVVAWLTGVI